MSKTQEPTVRLEMIDGKVVVVKVYPYKQPKKKNTRKFEG